MRGRRPASARRPRPAVVQGLEGAHREGHAPDAKILGVLNATDVFAGKNRTRVGEAIPYETITVEGELADGAVSIREGALNSPSITMAATGTVGFLDQSLDLMVLSHPLSTLDKVVQAVPVVRHVLGTRLPRRGGEGDGDPRRSEDPASLPRRTSGRG